MIKTVDIGYTSALDYWHRAANPAYMRFRDTPTKENAIECAQAIEDLRGWRWRDLHAGIDPRAQPQVYEAHTRNLFAACPDLAPIRDIAESAKHGGELGRGSVRVKSIKGSGIGGIEQVSSPFGMHERKPECTLQAEFDDGSEKSIPEMLRRAIEYWRNE